MAQTVENLCGQHCFTKGKLPRNGHYTGQPALAGTPVKNWGILLQQSFTASMPLLMATSAFRAERRH